MRILILSEFSKVVGGAQAYIRDIIPLLTESGHSVSICFERAYNSDNNSSIIESKTGIQWWSIAKQGSEPVLRSISDWLPDVVYSHGFRDFRLEAQIIKNKRSLFFLHNAEGNCISGTKFFKRPSVSECNLKLSPRCFYNYFANRCGGLNPITALRLYRQSMLKQKLLNSYNYILVASNWMSHLLSINGFQYDKVKLLPLFPCLQQVQFNYVKKDLTSINALFAGRIVRSKGWTVVIDCLSLLKKQGKKINLIVAGDGPDLEKMRLESFRLGLDVKFVGWCDDTQLSRLMTETHLLLMPSLWSEPFGLLGIEAGSFGVPVVGFSTGGMSDWLLSGFSGEAADSGEYTSYGLAKAINKALSSPSYYESLCRGALEISKKFNKQNHISKLEEYLGSIQ